MLFSNVQLNHFVMSNAVRISKFTFPESKKFILGFDNLSEIIVDQKILILNELMMLQSLLKILLLKIIIMISLI